MKESSVIELKEKFVPDLNKEVIAFANTLGGDIYIGINDDGVAVGLDNIDGVERQCSAHISSTIKPDISMFVAYDRQIIDGKDVLHITVEKGTSRPYYVVGKGIRPEGVYVRVGTTSVPANEAAIIRMIKETDGESYEECRSLRQDLTFDYMKSQFMGAGLEIGKSQMKTLGIINSDDLYTNLALLLSDQCKHTIKVAVFDGVEKITFKDRYEFTGCVLKQLNDAYEFIDRHNSTQSTFQGLKRIDKRQYPEEAIREALLNAIVHRDYAFGGSTLISMFDDRIEIVTLGGLAKGIEYDDIMLGVSVLRNTNLANIFYRLNFIEAYGTGIAKIKRNYAQNAIKPTFEVSNNAFKIVLPATNYERNDAKIELSEKYNCVMKLFESKEFITRADVEIAANVSSSTAVRLLNNLVDQSLIRPLGNTRSRCYAKV
jgi:ATP-dependent DNA helicase RecG